MFCSLEKRRKERPHIKEMKCLDRAKMAILGYFAEATERQNWPFPWKRVLINEHTSQYPVTGNNECYLADSR